MVYTIDIIDGKIEIPKPWKNKKRVKIREESAHYVIDFEGSDPSLSLEDENIKKLIEKGIKSGKPSALESVSEIIELAKNTK